MQLFLHDQGDDAVDTRYSVQTETGGILFLFNPYGVTAREVMRMLCANGEHAWINETPEPRCPLCDSPSRELHPAMQYEGEVQLCSDAWHLTAV